jgi:hypothetical protein
VLRPYQAEASIEEIYTEIERVDAEIIEIKVNLKETTADRKTARNDGILKLFLEKEVALEQRLTFMVKDKKDLQQRKSLREKELRANNGQLRQFPVRPQYCFFFTPSWCCHGHAEPPSCAAIITSYHNGTPTTRYPVPQRFLALPQSYLPCRSEITLRR